MTLVVARKVSDSFIHVVSDTRITDRTATSRRGYIKGALKSVVLSPTKCLCYAGLVSFALDAIAGIQKESLVSGDSRALISHLLTSHRESKHDTDFLLCDLEAGGTIHSFKNGQCCESRAGWVGNVQAFSYFQESLDSVPEHKPCDDLSLRMFSSMSRLVHSNPFPDIETVGDHVVVTSTCASGFYYPRYSISWPGELREGETRALNDAAHGGYAESILVPRAAGIGAIAVHIFPVNLGVLTAVSQFDQ